MGLTTVKRIIDIQGGLIRAESAMEERAAFPDEGRSSSLALRISEQ